MYVKTFSHVSGGFPVNLKALSVRSPMRFTRQALQAAAVYTLNFPICMGLRGSVPGNGARSRDVQEAGRFFTPTLAGQLFNSVLSFLPKATWSSDAMASIVMPSAGVRGTVEADTVSIVMPSEGVRGTVEADMASIVVPSARVREADTLDRGDLDLDLDRDFDRGNVLALPIANASFALTGSGVITWRFGWRGWMNCII